MLFHFSVAINHFKIKRSNVITIGLSAQNKIFVSFKNSELKQTFERQT